MRTIIKTILVSLIISITLGIGIGFIISMDKLIKVEKIRTEALKQDNSMLENRLAELKAVRTESQVDIQEYILTYYKTVAPTVAETIAKNILVASAKHDVPFVTVVAVMQVESQFNPAARSSKGARGLMQVMPLWMNELNLKSKYDFHNIQIGINSGTYILRKYLDQTKNNMEQALFKYVGGDNLYVKKVYEAMGNFVVYRSFANMTVNEEVKEVEVKDFNVQKTEGAPFVHTVTHRGETLSLIAKWYTGKVGNWKIIAQLNANIIPERMPIGAKITIPRDIMSRTTKLMKEYITEEQS